jgi:hypothetical protein
MGNKLLGSFASRQASPAAREKPVASLTPSGKGTVSVSARRNPDDRGALFGVGADPSLGY